MGGWNIDDVCVYAKSIPDPGDESGNGTDMEDYEVPTASADGQIVGTPAPVGCACSTGSSGRQFGWLVVLLGGLITARRRKEG